ncbi:MAG TPA: hypothetical protein VIJ25_18650, partial [Methylococcales bacterium]
QFNSLAIGRAIDKIGISKAKNMICPFGQYRVKPADRLDGRRKVVIVNQFGIAEHAGCLSEEPLDGVPVLVNLFDKFVTRIQKAQAVIIGLAEEFYAARLCERVKCTHYFRAVLVELLKQRAGDAVRNFESAFVPLYNIQQEPVCRQVAFIGDLAAYRRVFIVVKIVRAFIKDRIVPQPKGLMNLKIKTY